MVHHQEGRLKNQKKKKNQTKPKQNKTKHKGSKILALLRWTHQKIQTT